VSDGSNPAPITLEARRGRIHLRLTAVTLGRDLAVTLSGGDRPHIGAVALAGPGTPASALCLPQHREGELAQKTACTLAEAFNVAVSATCGIHLDAISPAEIAEVLAMADALTVELIQELEKG
jgi:hypothetical protein